MAERTEGVTNKAWHGFKREYHALLVKRFHVASKRFDDLAELATENNVFIGCSCPTKKNPVPGHCHTYLALEFMKKKYPTLDIVIPGESRHDCHEAPFA